MDNEMPHLRVILTPSVHRAWNSPGNPMGDSPNMFAKQACQQDCLDLVHAWYMYTDNGVRGFYKCSR